MKRMTLLLMVLFSQILAQNNVPIISNLSTVVDPVNQTVTFQYDLWDDENDDMHVYLSISDNSGETYLYESGSIRGDVGFPTLSGDAKQIQWSYNPSTVGSFKAKIVVDDRYEIDIAEIVARVDSQSIFNDVSALEGIRHRNTGVDDLQFAKQYIENEFTSNGLQTSRDEFLWSGYNAENIIGKHPGQNEEEAVLIIDGHFDTVFNSPGADDNGSGVAGMLEAMRVLSLYDFNKTIKFIGFDLEEEGLFGAINYVDEARPDYEQIEGAINLDMIGYYNDEPNSQIFPLGFDILFPQLVEYVAADDNRGNFIFNFANENSSRLMSNFNASATQYVPDLRVGSTTIPGNSELAPDLRRSDHAPFWDAGIQALFITVGGEFRSPHYHLPSDTIGTINFQFVEKVVKTTVATIADLAVPMHCGVLRSENFELFEHITVVQVPDDSLSIQSAIDGAWMGDTIIVAPGTYVENINFLGKDVFVRSAQGPEVTIIDGDMSGSVVSFHNGESAAAVLDGFTIRNGSGTFRDGDVFGGGIFISDSTSPCLKNLIVHGNSVSGGSLFGGGGIYVGQNSHPRLSKLTVMSNHSDLAGGGLLIDKGSNPILELVTIVNNTSTVYGGGVFIMDHCAPLFNQVTVANNSCDLEAGGIQMAHGCTPMIINSILWGNGTWQVALGGTDGYMPDSVYVAYSNIQGGLSDIWQGLGQKNWLDGNIDTEPLLNDSTTGDFSLLEASPCIDTGIASFELNGVSVLDMLPSDYIGVCPDMGAWEHAEIVAVEGIISRPEAFLVHQNYPNPFNPSTTISYELPAQSDVSIIVYDVLGQAVATLTSEHQTAGYQTVQWDGTNSQGLQVGAGMYLYTIKANQYVDTRKMILLK